MDNVGADWLSGVMSSWARIRSVAVVEALRIMRDRTSFSLIVLVPALQVILFGFTVNLNPKEVSIAIAGGAPSTQETVIRRVRETGYFSDIIRDLEPGEAREHLETGFVQLAIELPDDTAFFDDTGAETDTIHTARVFVDGSDAGAVAPALAALEKRFLWHAVNRLTEGEERGETQLQLPAAETIWLYNPDQRTAWTILPALIGVIAMICMLMLGALTLVREREQGSWEALIVMPASGLEVLVGKLAPYVLVALVQTILVIAGAVLLFDLPVAGSFSMLLAGTLLLGGTHLVLGFTISTLVSSQMQALQVAVAFYLPSMLLSGFMFPFSGMPGWAQGLGNLLPLTHFVRFARDVMLRGIGNAEAALHLVPILVFLIVFGAAALLLFRRRLA